MILAALILLLSAVIESAVVYVPFTVLMVLYMEIIFEWTNVWLLFFSGLVLDIWQDRLVGVNSLFFLIAVGIWQRYRRKLNTATHLYQIIYFTIVISIYFLLFYKSYAFPIMVGVILAAVILLILLKKIFPETSRRRRLSI